MEKLVRTNREALVDLLVARLAFERSAVSLYTGLLERVARTGDPMIARALPALSRIRFDESEHATWLEKRLIEVGIDPAVATPRARLLELEAEGLARVVHDPRRSVEETVHAIFAAELLDHAGWNLLVQLAGEAHDEDAQEELRKRLLEENEHLHVLRTLVQALARRRVFSVETDVTRRAA